MLPIALTGLFEHRFPADFHGILAQSEEDDPLHSEALERLIAVVERELLEPFAASRVSGLRACSLFTGEESRVISDDGNAGVSQVGPEQILVVGRGVLPPRKKMLRILVSDADVFSTYSLEPGCSGLGRSLTKAVVADGAAGRLITAVLRGQRFQRAICH